MTDAAVPPIDVALVRRLIAAQFPQWSALPVAAVVPGGWDNRTFRLGADLSVRLPSAARYAAAVEKEARWLPVLAPLLPLPIPSVVAVGAPGEGYPFAWSVRDWLPGRIPVSEAIRSSIGFRDALAGFLSALHSIPSAGGPVAGAHSFHRGADLRVYERETLAAAHRLGEEDRERALAIWSRATLNPYTGPRRWFHGDIATGNLLVADSGDLAAVIDFGTSGVGDPACDLVIAWNEFDASSRMAFLDRVADDAAMVDRARGWALWKALITLDSPEPEKSEWARRALATVLADA
ncbi:aminoglycoside phosphotransferase family protein [Herbiconiux sp. L3-i23]|uniref:aminoglycoside phosphotransferase family protein n=1 Tax=Herbiconiux sp. L3-i23 TaxID=2905871 RepID=UPI002059580D|nr:aminoglycoside phosphotransferase family protein [Herbiconiux sp. L3-i23]BDI23227.1 aminoglycoside phosphotransferase [Herbiconiux sp. L3-i23]